MMFYQQSENENSSSVFTLPIMTMDMVGGNKLKAKSLTLGIRVAIVPRPEAP